MDGNKSGSADQVPNKLDVLASATRFEEHYDDLAVDKRRSSRRMSATSKVVLPRLSVTVSRKKSVGHKIKFDFQGNEKKGRNPKETISNVSFDRLLTQDRVNKSLEMKEAYRTAASEIYGFSVSEAPSYFISTVGGRSRFVGDMQQGISSKYSETDVPVVPLSMPGSKFVSLGHSSEVLLDTLWPWPWLPQTKTTSEFINKTMQPVTFSKQDKLLTLPEQPIDITLSRFQAGVQLFVKPYEEEHLNQLLKGIVREKTKMACTHETKRASCNCPWTRLVQENIVPLYFTRLEAPLTNTAILAPFMWDLWPERNDSQIDRAVIFIQIVSEFVKFIQQERVKVFYDDAGYPLCNHQFRKLFSSVKIPGMPADATHCFFKTIRELDYRDSPGHIIVICRGQIFSLDIMHMERTIMPTSILAMNLKEIVKIAEKMALSEDRATCHGVCFLTSMDRDVWSERRVQLMDVSENNRACLQTIEEALFVLSLDHMNCRGPERLTEDALFANGCNRWYDKGLSFYMYNNGLMTVNISSSILDASTVNVLLQYVHTRILQDQEKWDDEVYRKSGLTSQCVSSDSIQIKEALSEMSNLSLNHDVGYEPSASSTVCSNADMQSISHLKFDLDDKLMAAIGGARESFNKMKDSLSVGMCHCTVINDSFLSDRDIPPEAFCHMALQLTFYKMYFRPAAVSVKVTLKRFFHGRYDVILVTSLESITWCKAMLDPNVSNTDRLIMFRAAIDRHKSLVDTGHAGLSCYSSLSALRVEATNSNNQELLDILDELLEFPAGTPETMDLFCGATVPNGCLSVAVVNPPSIKSYGVGFAEAKGKLLFTVTAWKENPGTCAENFVASLHGCLKELRRFLLAY